MDYVKVTKFGYEIWKGKRHVGTGIGLSILQFVNFKYPETREEKRMAKHGIYKLKSK